MRFLNSFFAIFLIASFNQVFLDAANSALLKSIQEGIALRKTTPNPPREGGPTLGKVVGEEATGGNNDKVKKTPATTKGPGASASGAGDINAELNKTLADRVKKGGKKATPDAGAGKKKEYDDPKKGIIVPKSAAPPKKEGPKSAAPPKKEGPKSAAPLKKEGPKSAAPLKKGAAAAKKSKKEGAKKKDEDKSDKDEDKSDKDEDKSDKDEDLEDTGIKKKKGEHPLIEQPAETPDTAKPTADTKKDEGGVSTLLITVLSIGGVAAIVVVVFVIKKGRSAKVVTEP